MKNNEWLTAESFEQTQEIVSAINTLSIHAKLTLAEIDDSDRGEEVREARTRLLAFLARFEAVVQAAEQRPEGAVLGVDPRLGQLARKFLSAKSQWPQKSALYAISFAELRRLLTSDTSEDLKALVNVLHDLRALVEQHAHADVAGILGDI